MRTCPNCGHMLNEKDTICFKCGMQLSQISTPNMGSKQSMMGQQLMGNGRPQQPMFPQNNNINNRPNNNKKPGDKKDNSSIYLIIGVIVLLAALATVIFFVTKNNKLEDDDEETPTPVVITDPEPEPIEPDPDNQTDPDPDNQTDPNPDNQTEPEPPVQEPDPNPNNQESTKYGEHPEIKEGFHEVRNNGYAYAVPDEYTAKDYATQGFDILNYQKTKEMMISINLGSLTNLKQTLPAVKQMYIDSGAAVKNIKVTTIADREVICVELTKNSQNMIIGITDAAEGEIFVVAVYAVKTNEFDYNLLEEGINIVKTAVKTNGVAVNTSANA